MAKTSRLALTREQEKALFLDLKAGTKYEFAGFSSRHKPVYRAVSRTKKSEQARQQLVNYNFGLVFSVVGGMTPRFSQYFDDLFQEASLVLLRAVDTFRLEKGNRFSVYLQDCLRKNLPTKLREMMHFNVVHVPRGKYEHSLKLEEKAYQQGKGFEQLCEEQGISKQERQTLIAAGNAKKIYSCDDSYDNNGRAEKFSDFLEDKFQILPEQKLMQQENHDYLLNAVNRVLTPCERRVVLDYFRGDVLLKIGNREGFTKEGIRQIKKRAIKKLRRFAILYGVEAVA